ncbi:MAG: LamG-like jellyroll fold domain-containing protein [Sedimentisphaeraceae bacterium JB056]
MKKNVVLMMSIVLALGFCAQASTWSGAVSDDWTDTGNWDSLPSAGTHAFISNTNPAKIYSDDTGASNITQVEAASSPGGSLTVEGTLNANIVKIANTEATTGTITVDGGEINTLSYANIGTKGTGTLVMNSGTFNCGGNFSVPSAYYGGLGYGIVELNGGTINAADIFMNSHGQINVGEGQIIISADILAEVNGYVASGYIVASQPYHDIQVTLADGVTTIESVPGEMPAYMAPYTDLIGYNMLLHMDANADANDLGFEGTIDDDSDNPGRDKDPVKYIGTTAVAKDAAGGPILVTPDVYPADNADFDKCYSFDGIGDNFRLIDDDNLVIDPMNVRIEAWVKIDENSIYQSPGTQYDYYIFNRRQQIRLVITDAGTDLGINSWRLGFTLYAENGNHYYPAYYYGSSIDASPFEWHHVALEVYGGSIKLYVNDVLVTPEGKVFNNDDVLAKTSAGDVTYIGCLYNNTRFFNGWIDEMRVGPAQWVEPECGGWGYSPADFNEDCSVDLLDYSEMFREWLQTYDDSGASTAQSRDIPLPGNYNVPQATVTPVIDGTISAGEWDDAKPIEMIYPDLIDEGNTGTLTRLVGTPPTPEDYSLFWYMKWDSSGLYVLGRVYDDIFSAAIGLDEPQFSFNLNNNLSAVFLDEAIVWNLPANGSINVNGGLVYNDSVLSGSVLSDGYVVEFKFAWSDLTSVNGGSAYTPQINDVHGIGFTCQDHDADGERECVLLDYGSNETWAMTDLSTWNTITLVDNLTCGDLGYMAGDFNEDCLVNEDDLDNVITDWLGCSDPFVEGCEDFRL